MESQIVKQTHVLPRNFFDSFRNRWLDSYDILKAGTGNDLMFS